MKRVLLLIAVLFAGLETAYSQTKIQFVEAQLGQSIMLQGNGYSLFGNAVGDNHAFTESVHVGWGKDFSRSTGAFLEANTISMPNYAEFAAFVSLGFEIRNYREIAPSLRCHWGALLGGSYAVNSYTLVDVNERASRWGIHVAFSAGAEMSFGEHLYIGSNLSILVISMLTSSFEPSSATPQEGTGCLFGNKLMITAGYRF